MYQRFRKRYHVYIATNKGNTTLYTGMTSILPKRIYQHKNKEVEGFTKKHNINKLVFYEEFYTPEEAIAAEKQIKGWSRKKKIDLIKKRNPNFKDLSDDF